MQDAMKSKKEKIITWMYSYVSKDDIINIKFNAEENAYLIDQREGLLI